MSEPKKQKAVIESYTHCTFEQNDDCMRMRFTGLNTAGTDTELVVDLPWRYIPYFLRDMRKIWELEREAQAETTNRINASLADHPES